MANELSGRPLRDTRRDRALFVDREEPLRAAEKTDLRGIQVAYVEFVVTGAKAQKLGHAIGFPSPPC